MNRFLTLTSRTITPVLALVTACGGTSENSLNSSRAGQGTGSDSKASSASPTGDSSQLNDTTPAGGDQTESSETLDNPKLPQFACDVVASQQFDTASMKAYSLSTDVQQQVESVLDLMGPAEKASQMIGVDGSLRDYQDVQRSPDMEVPGVGTIRGYRYRDGNRGVNLNSGQDNRPNDGNNFATVFPTPSLRAASWDLDLEKRVGAAVGDETAASKNNMLLAPSADIIRHPYWGRTQEAYGEDMYHVGRMATAFTVGAQEYVAACARHFVANNIEKDKSSQNAVLNEQALREIYGRNFEMIVQDGGVACVMTGYNQVNGLNPTQSTHLIRDVLEAPVAEGGFGFEGLVLTDWWAMPGHQSVPDATMAQSITNEAVIAGTDIEMPWTFHYNQTTLANADESRVEEAARRILTQKFRFGTALDTDAWSRKTPTSTLTGGSITPSQVHEALAETAAIKSAVLLTNGPRSIDVPVLPLRGAKNIAVVGLDQSFSLIASSVPKSCKDDIESEVDNNPRACTFHFATDPAFGDRGPSLVNGDPARTVGPFQGIQQAAGAGTTVISGNSADAAAGADAVVVVVGYTPGDEGEEWTIAEGGDRSSLDLPPGQNELVSSVLDLGLPTVIIIESGSIVNLPWLSHGNRTQANIWAGYPGTRGGTALGKLIFGQENFSGKMPMAWPTEDQLQQFKETDTMTTMGYFFGYREFDRQKYIEGTPVDMVFPFGHGLSYSSFEYSNLALPCTTATKDAIINVTVDITNTSKVDGDEVAMLFVKPPPKPAGVTGDRPWKELKSFARVPVSAGQTVSAELPLRIRDLRRWEGDENGHWVIDSGDYTILVGKDAEDAENASNVGTIAVNGD